MLTYQKSLCSYQNGLNIKLWWPGAHWSQSRENKMPVRRVGQERRIGWNEALPSLHWQGNNDCSERSGVSLSEDKLWKITWFSQINKSCYFAWGITLLVWQHQNHTNWTPISMLDQFGPVSITVKIISFHLVQSQRFSWNDSSVKLHSIVDSSICSFQYFF